MTHDDFESITADAARLAVNAFRVCDIGIVPLAVFGGEWHLLFGQQHMTPWTVAMLGDIEAAIAEAGGVRFNVMRAAAGTVWAALVRLPAGTALPRLRTMLYRTLAEHSGQPVEDIRRVASTYGESAVLDAGEQLRVIAARVDALMRSIQPPPTPPAQPVGRVASIGDEVVYRHRDDADDASTEQVVSAVIESIDNAGRVALRVFLDADNFRRDDAVYSATQPFGWFWPTR